MRNATIRPPARLVVGGVLCALLLVLVTTGCSSDGDTPADDTVVSLAGAYESTRTSERTDARADERTDARTESDTDSCTDTTQALPDDASTSTTSPLVAPTPPQVKLTNLYDNHVLPPTPDSAPIPRLAADWGFACLVQGASDTILFDTGAHGLALLSNMDALGVDPAAVDLVVLSHRHGDHTGGLTRLLTRNPDVTVYCPASFSQSFTQTIEAVGASVVRVADPVSPCPGVTITAPLDGGSVDELGLLLDTSEGPVLLTGCSHPGVVDMARAATDLAGQPLHAVLGGFHLHNRSSGQVADVIAELQGLGVAKCGPSHCTGDHAIAQVKEAFGSDFIPMGVGAVVEF